MDLVIRGGRVVSAGFEATTDVGVADGRIVQLGGEMSAPTEIDATGRYVLPGGVDGHVHLTPPSSGGKGWAWADDFTSGTAAALAGGITTVGNMSHPHAGQTMREAFERDAADGLANSLADFVLHPILMDPVPSELDEIDRFAQEGHTTIKIFLSFRRFERNVDGYLDAMRRIAGTGGLALLHCEDVAVMDCCCRILQEEGRTDARYYPRTRPVAAERAATERAVAFSEVTGCPILVVHLAAAAALEACQRGQALGLPTYVETRPLYLHLTKERFDEPDGPKYAGAPPLREAADVEALWAGIAGGWVATLATDHAPWKLADKLDPANTAREMRLGVSELETSLPMLWWAGVATGRITVRRFVEVTATNPAKLLGLYGRKGVVAPGADADLLVWNERTTRIVDASSWQSRADFSPYDGWEVSGWPEVVIGRGEVLCRNGRLTDAARPGRAQLVPQGRSERL
jgi:dihydropyrimidinase